MQDYKCDRCKKAFRLMDKEYPLHISGATGDILYCFCPSCEKDFSQVLSVFLAPIEVTIRHYPDLDEYRMRKKFSTHESTYYTDDLEDAVLTAIKEYGPDLRIIGCGKKIYDFLKACQEANG